MSDEAAEVATQIKQIHEAEQDANIEQEEYETEISQRLNELDATAAEILVGLRADAVEQERATQTLALHDKDAPAHSPGTARSQTISGLYITNEGDGVYDEQPLHSCFPQNAHVDESIITWDNDSIALSHNSNTASIQRSTDVPLRTRQRTPSLQSSKSRSTGRRRTLFPAQRNTLMSWVRSLPQRIPTDSNTLSPPAVTPLISKNASPLPSSPIVQPNPALVNPTPSPAPTPAARASPNAPDPNAAASLAPAERTAFKLAKQFRNFQGCTHEQHREADQLHREHYRRPDVHSECSSLGQLTHILRGNNREHSFQMSCAALS